MYPAAATAHWSLMALKMTPDFLQVTGSGFAFLLLCLRTELKTWAVSLQCHMFVLMVHWRASMFNRVLAALCGLYWSIIAPHCTWSLEKDFLLHGQTPLGPGHNAWFSVVVSVARVLIKMPNSSLSATLRAVQIFGPCF